MRANPTPATYEPDTPKTAEEEAIVAAFGFDKKPGLAELMAVAAAKMLDGAAQFSAAMKKIVVRS